MQQEQSLKSGDIYCEQEKSTAKYFAYQLIHIKEDNISFLLLDYWKEDIPTNKDIKSMIPFIRERWFFNDSPNLCYAGSGKIPVDAIYVGNRSPIITDECRTYGYWSNGFDFIEEEKWKCIPEKIRIEFKSALNDCTTVTIAGKEIRRATRYIGDELLSTLGDYTELRKLPAAISFTATTYYPQLIPFLESSWIAYKLDWRGHGQQELDFSHTHLQELTLNAEGVKSIHLPISCEKVNLTGKLLKEMKLYSPCQGANITLNIAVNENQISDMGLTKLQTLFLNQVDRMDLSTIVSSYPYLHELRIWGKPGYISNITSLGELKELSWLSLQDLFGFTPQEFPSHNTWPLLNKLWLESIPEEVGKHIKKIYKGKIHDLDIRKLRKADWLAENLDNPLRHWDGSEFIPASKFKKAMVIYRNTRREALAASTQYLNHKDSGVLQHQLEQIGKEYALLFNKLDHKSYFIETEEREDLCAAFKAILDAVDTTFKN